MTELWDVKEAARRTKTSVALWRKLIAGREIPVVRVGRCVRLDPEHVTAFLAARTQQAMRDPKSQIRPGEAHRHKGHSSQTC